MRNIIILITVFLSNALFAQVGVGTTNPDISSIMELQSNNRGFLLPRVSLTSTTDVTTIPNPAEGLMIYNLDSNCDLPPGLYVFDGSFWRRFQYDNTVSFSRLIRDEIGVANVTFSNINSINTVTGTFESLFDDVDNTAGFTIHVTRTGTPSGDWGFGIALPNAYYINSLVLDGRNDCCTNRIENVVARLYRCGNLIYTSSPITSAVIDDNVITIPNIYADEIRLIVPNGGDVGSGDGIINFSELDVVANQ